MEKESRIIVLPSQGLPYEETIPQLFESKGQIKIYPMTAREEKLLAGAGNMSINALMTTLFNNTVDEKIPFNKLLSADRFFILMQLRIFTWSGEYKNHVQCQNCREHYNLELDLENPDDIFVKRFDEENFSPTFDVTLPKSGQIFELKRLTGEDEMSIEKSVKRYKKMFPEMKGDAFYSLRFAKHVISIDGEEVGDLFKTAKEIDKLHAKDINEIRKEIEKHECGYELLLESECPSCMYDNETFLEFTAKFFRP